MFDSKIPDKAARWRKRSPRCAERRSRRALVSKKSATVYDPRMLGILRKASKYDRMMAAAEAAAQLKSREQRVER